MVVCVIGKRGFIPRPRHKKWLIEQLRSLNATEVISGMSNICEKISGEVAESIGIPVKKIEIKPIEVSERRIEHDFFAFLSEEAFYKRQKELADLADVFIVLQSDKSTDYVEVFVNSYGKKIVKLEEKI